ncbi:MAG TPA: alpha/beta hydrolase [Streptosporangiaceae bacterium]|nr:alpha/beta hydrolase [Streptosporangiaceae bacterium]
MPRLLAIVAALGLAAASCGGHPAPAASASAVNSLTVKSCTVNGLAARCGTLIVLEDRLTGTGRTIPVRFVIIPAASRDKAPDPVVWFAGGPGDSAVTDIPGELSALSDLGLHRDLVFIEQRSTGSSNPLNCPDFPGTLADRPAVRASVESCLAHLPGDLRFYTTAMYADDVNQVLADLHYATANFVGISYGTIAEQVFLLRHPGRVRTLTMISGSPLNVPVYQRAPGNSQLALDHVFALCQSQAACHGAFPHLAADWAALRASVGKSPVVIPAAQSPTGTTLRLDQDWFAGKVYDALFTGDIGPLPVMLHTLAVATDKVAAMLTLTKAFPAAPSSGGANQMLFYAFRCDEPWSSVPPATLSGQRGSFAYQSALQTARWYQYVCPLIPKSAAAVGHEQLTVSMVPVLAFNGAYDPIEQPQNWAGARQVFPDSLHVTLPGQGHDTTNTWGVCAGPLTQTFIEQGSVAHLNTGCLAAAAPPPFDLTLP